MAKINGAHMPTENQPAATYVGPYNYFRKNDWQRKNMLSLIINAPKQQEISRNAQSFEQTLSTGIGAGYAINRNLFQQIHPGCKVVLLSKDRKLRAEGELIRLVPTCKTKNGIQRYDVHVSGFVKVPYRSERLNRNGVALKDELNPDSKTPKPISKSDRLPEALSTKRHIALHGGSRKYEIINCKIDLIMSNIDKDLDIRTYLNLLSRFRKNDVTRDTEFQNKYCRYWRLFGAGLSQDFRSEYFQLMEGLKGRALPSIREVTLNLFKVPSNSSGRKTLQFSFASKLLHTLDSHRPIYDSMVARFYGFSSPNPNNSFENRLQAFLSFYDFLVAEYNKVLTNRLLEQPITIFRNHFSVLDEYTDEKIVDTLIWRAMDLQKKGGLRECFGTEKRTEIMPFIQESTGYEKTILSDLQGAWSLLRDSVVEAVRFEGWDRALFHIDEAMSWESIRNLKRMLPLLLIIRNICVKGKASEEVLENIRDVDEVLKEVLSEFIN